MRSLIILLVSLNCWATEITEFSFILKPSTIPDAGVGVFAAHDIEKGSTASVLKDNQWRIVHKKDIPEDFLKMCAAQGDGYYICARRFDHMEICWYLNHSDTPNIDMIDFKTYRANRDIKKGEEIFMDYNQLNEPESEKEKYYKN